MSQLPPRACPLCGSVNVTVTEPDRDQAASGVVCILKCECGAVISLYAPSSGHKDAVKTPG